MQIPLSSKNDELQHLLAGKRRVVALNKKDLANPNIMHVMCCVCVFLVSICNQVLFMKMCFFFLFVKQVLFYDVGNEMSAHFILCRNGLGILIRSNRIV